MNAGETERFYCEECSTEFEVTLEPKAQGFKGAPGTPEPEPKEVAHCPFCGDSNVEAC